MASRFHGSRPAENDRVALSRRWGIAACAVLLVTGCRSLDSGVPYGSSPSIGDVGVVAVALDDVPVESAAGEPIPHEVVPAVDGRIGNPSHGDVVPSWHRDLREFGPMLRDDAIGVVSDPLNVSLLAASLGGAIAIRQDLDGRVRDDTAVHSERWGDGSRIVGHLGEAPVQIPVLLGLHWLSLEREDEELHEFSRSLISAYTVMGLSTLAIKGVTNTERPSPDWNGGQYGFPSFHAASTTTIAGIVQEHYGTGVALPFYGLAGVVAWTRIDERDHDLSDVVFGTAMGYVIGKSVARRHLEGDSRVRVAPWIHPSGEASGLIWTLDF